MITGRTVTVLRYTTDRYGDRTKVSEHTVNHCAYAPRTTAGGRDRAELTDRSAGITADAELYVPYGVDITPQDVIQLGDGTEWEVIGLQEPWESPWPGAWQAGAVIPLRRRTG
jgi:hypothetical protein